MNLFSGATLDRAAPAYSQFRDFLRKTAMYEGVHELIDDCHVT
jgi:hypothetical protein